MSLYSPAISIIRSKNGFGKKWVYASMRMGGTPVVRGGLERSFRLGPPGNSGAVGRALLACRRLQVHHSTVARMERSGMRGSFNARRPRLALRPLPATTIDTV